MAINLLPLLPSHSSTFRHPPWISSFKPLSQTLSISIPQQSTHHSLLHPKHSQRLPSCSVSPSPSPSPSPSQFLSSSSSSPPPSTREEAISQAKACLSAALQKPFNNPITLPTRKLKKQRQPRFRVEIPLLDDSPDSLTQLAQDVFLDMPITRKGARPTILVLWTNPSLSESARQAFSSAGSAIANSALASVTSLGSADLVVFMAPEASDLDEIKMITSGLDPKPVVLFNPKWGFEEERDFAGGLGSFVGSFDVVYSFMGLEVRGILNRRKGVVFRCVRDGVVSGEGWVVMVEEDGEKGDWKVVTRFKKRPSIGEVEGVLYNLMAANSPVTKSVKFLRDLASNVTGKKAK